MSQPTSGGGYGGGADALGQAPETDAQHSAWADQFAQDLSDLGDRLREHREMLEAEVNMHPSVMAGLDEAAEHLSEAAVGMTNHAQDYASTYEGVRETAQATGGHIPGLDPNNTYWGETA
jgi:hypothetical protein